MALLGLPALFALLTALLAGIAWAAAHHGRWIIAIPALGLAAWMGSMAWSAVVRARRR